VTSRPGQCGIGGADRVVAADDLYMPASLRGSDGTSTAVS
jgi:hypothetical protein